MKTVLLLFFGFIGTTTFAQSTHHCGDAAHDEHAAKRVHQVLQNHTKTNEVRIIPVVFHVLHQYGYENISDAQILDAVVILNNDFNRLNADTSFVTAPFDSIIGNVAFEFRLAHLDPYGNPTTGIDRIVTPLTNNANMDSRINTWDATHYVNIWVVNSIEEPGIAGWADNPFVTPFNPCNAGITILNDFVGSIGTASPGSSRELTHEMGHYFGLFHTFETLGVCGGSDGIYDTPYTKGNTSCNTSSNTCDDSNFPDSYAYWNFDPRDNVENFMDFSYCGRMFTNGQVELMRAVQEDPQYFRDQLSVESNLIATGTGPGPQTASTALPGAEFDVSDHMTCAGFGITMLNGTGMAAGTSYSWSFPGGTPSTSTQSAPQVVYTTPGYYDITLTTTNANGSNSTTQYSTVYVSGDWAEFTGPTMQDFDSEPLFWQTWNLNNDNSFFSRYLSNGVNGTSCYSLNNFLLTDSSALCSPVYYENALEDHVDELVSPAYNLQGMSNITISFDYAYASAATNISDMTEKLQIYVSNDCGNNWGLRMTLTDTALTTAFENIGVIFSPDAGDWKHASLTLPPPIVSHKCRIKFKFTAKNHSNTLSIDNVQIDGTVGLSEYPQFTLNLFPNPISGNGVLNIISNESLEGKMIQLIDLRGTVLLEQEIKTDHLIALPGTISSGSYFIKINGAIKQLIID